jgi:hypothetical protein
MDGWEIRGARINVLVRNLTCPTPRLDLTDLALSTAVTGQAVHD